jgi:hypothetical protein
MKNWMIIFVLTVLTVVQADDEELLTRILSSKPYLTKIKPSVKREYQD